MHSTVAYDEIQSLLGFLVEFPSKTDDELIIRQATKTFRESYPEVSISIFRKKCFIFASQLQDSDDTIRNLFLKTGFNQLFQMV